MCNHLFAIRHTVCHLRLRAHSRPSGPPIHIHRFSLNTDAQVPNLHCEATRQHTTSTATSLKIWRDVLDDELATTRTCIDRRTCFSCQHTDGYLFQYGPVAPKAPRPLYIHTYATLRPLLLHTMSRCNASLQHTDRRPQDIKRVEDNTLLAECCGHWDSCLSAAYPATVSHAVITESH
jgi:hypothetical protein